MSAAPVPLYDGDGLFPPKLSVHPNWVYNTGRVQTPWSDVLEPEGLKPPSHGTGADQDRDSASMPKALSHRPKRARTDKAQASSSSSSAQPPPPPQPEDEPARPMWMEVPIPEGATGYNFMFFKPDGSLCRTVLLTTTRDINEYPPSIHETPKYVDNPADGTIGIEHHVRRLVTYLSRLQSVTQSNAKGLNLTSKSM